METKDIILELRTKNKMSQDELAEKVFVTRQAVSRWESGETVPNTETLKLLSKLFDISINTLLASPFLRLGVSSPKAFPPLYKFFIICYNTLKFDIIYVKNKGDFLWHFVVNAAHKSMRVQRFA